MNIRFVFVTGLFSLMIGSLTTVYPMGGKVKIFPMKTYSYINIPDGEFLDYGVYTGGVKKEDIYYVIKKETNAKGGIYYRIYTDTISITNNKLIRKNYTNWPGFSIIDPKQGAVIEAEKYFDTNSLADFSAVGGNIFYYHYQLNDDRGYVDFVSKTKSKEDVISTTHSRVNVQSGSPVWDRGSMWMFSTRFMDFKSVGVVFLIVPEVLKTPLSCTFTFISKETISTKAGTFRVNKVGFMVSDPFLMKLMGWMAKDVYSYVDESDRRIMVKTHTPSSEWVLEEISNVNLR